MITLLITAIKNIIYNRSVNKRINFIKSDLDLIARDVSMSDDVKAQVILGLLKDLRRLESEIK